MALQLENLDEPTRQFMLDEFEQDMKEGRLYISSRLNDAGQREYESLLRKTIKSGDDSSLAEGLRGKMKLTEQRRKQKGGFTTAKVPVTAHNTLAEGEFNRFYARGLCRRALEDGIPELVIYRAKQVVDPRPESLAMIGTKIDAKLLLEDLRTHPGVDTALHLPPGPNSGLSVRLP